MSAYAVRSLYAARTGLYASHTGYPRGRAGILGLA